jgi:hypothetical protein
MPRTKRVASGKMVANGLVSMNGDGSYTFTPTLGYVGPASFNFLVSDGIDSASGTVTIDVTNSTPTIWGNSITVRHDQFRRACSRMPIGRGYVVW